ncbi:hypothetical protein [Nocardioides coralli]|uniref:hypothetical protein n=1 Tax=Nocardioides coralli TaxID=2872154 RepID=UPI001CA42ABF|nr:hypothetical protein [Nocardioides coralli]QZY28043.1 hypothetical protein K6T13_11120 [Nocardioides coralli]
MSPHNPTSRPAYDDFATPQEMRADCVQVGENMRLRKAARRAVEAPPSIHFDDYPREVRKRDVSIDEATARLADALHLHLD